MPVRLCRAPREGKAILLGGPCPPKPSPWAGVGETWFPLTLTAVGIAWRLYGLFPGGIGWGRVGGSGKPGCG